MDRFALFSECLLVGVWIAVAAAATAVRARGLSR